MSIADFFFGRKQNSTNSRRSVKLNRNAVRTRTLSMEPLETRDLLSVTTGYISDSDYSALRTQYPDFNLPADQSTLNVMTVDCNLADLKSAITKAGSSTKPDLILVKTTDSANTIKYSSSSDEITIDIDSSQYGPVTIIGWGTKELTLNANEKCRVMAIRGKTDAFIGNTCIKNGYGWGYNGGGIFSSSSGVLVLINCTISNNSAKNGGSSESVYSYGGGIFSSSNISLQLINCTISNNSVTAYNDGSYVSNRSYAYGGGIFSSSSGTLLLKNCTIDNNASNITYKMPQAFSYGGGICNTSGKMTLMDCIISNNSTNSSSYYYSYSYGGGIYSSSSSVMQLTNCTITGNSSTIPQGNTEIISYGGGIYSSSTTTLTNCLLSNNTISSTYASSITKSGGSIYQNGSILSVISSDISSSSNNCSILGISGNLSIKDSMIKNAEMSITNGNSWTILNSFIIGADSNNGISISSENTSSKLIVANSIIRNCKDGLSVTTPVQCTLINSTITNNSGNGIYTNTNSVFYINNSIIAKNKTDISKSNNSSISANNTLSSYTNWSSGINNTTYQSSQPLFIDDSNFDYRLAENSQAINKGNNSYAVDSLGQTLTTDLAGIPRIIGGIVDIGAYEYDSRTALSIPEFTTIANETSATVNISPVEDAVSYRIEYSLNDDFTDSTTIDAQEGENVLNDLQFLQTYYVRVKSIGNDDFLDSDYSTAQSFIIIPSLTGLTLSTDVPTVGSTIIATIDSPYATVDYQWYCGETAIVGATESSFTVTAEQYGQTITCIVAGTGYYSESFSATTAETVKFATPDGYNDNDYQKMVAFLEQTDSDGVKNGTKLNANYDPANPLSWTGVNWDTVDGEERIVSINISCKWLVGSADFSNMTSLTTLYCSSNQLASNQLTSLNISSCTALTKLVCDSNQLISLDVFGCTDLTELNCSFNRLSSLDVSTNATLTYLSCYSNQLTSLDTSSCISLKTLSCYSNQLTSLNISDCTELISINCTGNRLTELDVSDCTVLESLACSDNQMTAIDLINNKKLTLLGIGDPYLSKVRISDESITTLKIRFYQSDYIVTNSHGSSTIEDSSYSTANYYQPAELPFTATSVMTGKTITFASEFHLTSLTLSSDSSEVGSAITATVNPFYATVDYQWYCGTTIIDNATASSFTVTEEQIGQTITCVATGTGDYTGTVSATTAVVPALPLGTPNKPTLTVEDTTITATWSVVGNASAFTVEYQVDGSDDWFVITGINGTTTSFVGIAGTKYNVKVQANGTGNYTDSEYSESASIYIPIPLTGLTLSTNTPTVGTVITTILLPSDATVEYQWYSGETAITGATTSSFSVTEEQIGQTITCVVTANGNYTGSVSATTAAVPALPLDAPDKPMLTVEDKTISVSWSAVEHSSGYTVEYKFGSSDWSVLATTEETTASLTGQPGIEYSFRVKAIGTGIYADSEYSPVDTITIADTLDAHNDFVKTTLNSPVVIDYRENDAATDWSVVTVQFGEASHGEYVVNEDGTISYTPENGFFGTDTIGYALFSPSGKASVGSISISVGLPIATSVQKTSSSHSPSTAMAPSVDSLTDWENCCVELWAQGVNELNSGETTVTLEYNPAVYEVPYFSACPEGVALAASEGVVLPNGNVEIQLTVQVLEPISSQTDNLFLGTVVLTPSEDGYGAEDGVDAPACVLDGLELTTTVEAMPYDLVRNGAVDVNDFVAFATIFGTNLETMSPDNPLYAQALKADFNNDKIVNVDDFVMFAIKFGATKKRVEIPAVQASAAAEAGNREWEVGNGEVIDSQVETPVAQSAAPASQLVTRNSQLESTMTLLEVYSDALLDLYDNQESFAPDEPGVVLAESRLESPVASYSDGSSQHTPFDAVDAVLEEDLLAIDWE